MPPSLTAHAYPSDVLALILGGHTTEMIRLLQGFPSHALEPIHYVIAATDAMSLGRLLKHDPKSQEHQRVLLTPRAREVGQSYVTSIASTLYALLFAILLVWKTRPQLLFINGPGTCIPLCLAVLGFRFLGLLDTRVIYVESICRVVTLSLTAKLLLPWAEHEKRKDKASSSFTGNLSGRAVAQGGSAASAEVPKP
ncbi:uncharacterized protein MONBRDRAFT_28936 [Monosiga brevicollis MX1]|uniref:UDP-N-acetylglucosamine transferase subunit ALG14 n=1 Tax=Monosiga brevicollis TaxID=81824 RepID=A9V9M0_MONBE|nr:uncharacterized protein MONBRDRAFT_28936 [Monosiga brevicollis MX1]EDQ85692.1 predicted protein [Monosiga brevicollis MX1]|eukprot:XP_001749407.1 hypothetical protein [Monosiga brevicollis MX1]